MGDMEESILDKLAMPHVSKIRFPLKLWKLLSVCKSGAISWSQDGTSFIINRRLFQAEYLGRSGNTFKTQNLSSLVRQLNLYGFQKVQRRFPCHKLGLFLGISKKDWPNFLEYRHVYFRRDYPEEVTLVQRRYREEDEEDATACKQLTIYEYDTSGPDQLTVESITPVLASQNSSVYLSPETTQEGAIFVAASDGRQGNICQTILLNTVQPNNRGQSNRVVAMSGCHNNTYQTTPLQSLATMGLLQPVKECREANADYSLPVGAFSKQSNVLEIINVDPEGNVFQTHMPSQESTLQIPLPMQGTTFQLPLENQGTAFPIPVQIQGIPVQGQGSEFQSCTDSSCDKLETFQPLTLPFSLPENAASDIQAGCSQGQTTYTLQLVASSDVNDVTAGGAADCCSSEQNETACGGPGVPVYSQDIDILEAMY